VEVIHAEVHAGRRQRAAQGQEMVVEDKRLAAGDE
jgi:hypothetical protein